MAYITVTIIANWIRESEACSGPADVCSAQCIRSLYVLPGLRRQLECPGPGPGQQTLVALWSEADCIKSPMLTGIIKELTSVLHSSRDDKQYWPPRIDQPCDISIRRDFVCRYAKILIVQL